MNNSSIKSQFPIFTSNPDLVYLDNAATSQKPIQVIEAEIEFYKKYNANVHRGIHILSEEATAAYEQSRESIASLINAKPQEIIFTSGTTDSINKLALALEGELKSNQQILTTPAEHHSNLLPWQQLAKRTGAQLLYADLDDSLEINLEILQKQLEQNSVKIIVISHISNVTGVISPIKEIADLAHRYSAMLCVDGAQAMGHTVIDMNEMGADFYSFSGHKMYGPTGIGVLWGKQDLLKAIPPLSFGGGMIEQVERNSSTYADIPHKHEAGTPNIAGAIGLKAAADFIVTNIKQIEEIKLLAKYALDQLKEIEEITIVGPADLSKRGDVISFNLKGIHPHDIAQSLDIYKVAVRAGHHCCQILHREILHLPATTRASFAVYNTKEDVDKLIEGLKNTITQFQI